MPILTTLGVATGSAEGLLAKANFVYYNIPASGSITQYFNLAYAYGNPTVFSWTSNGTTLTYSISSATTYCGSTYSTSGTTPITQTGVTSSFTASISGTTLSVSAVASGSITVGQTITGAGVAEGTIITGMQWGGTGGAGGYTINTSQTISSTSMTGYNPQSNTVVQTATTPVWVHPKDCCNGNRNTIYEYYMLTMNSATTATLSAISTNASQTGC